MLLLDSVLLISVLLASFSVRLGYWYFPEDGLIWVVFGAPLIAFPIFVHFGLYRAVIRYIGFKVLWAIVQAVSFYALIWGMAGFMVAAEGIPRSVVLINWVLSLLVIGGVRVVARWLLTGGMNKVNKKAGCNCRRVLVYGAGDAGIQLVSALEHSKEYCPVGFIDDSTGLQGSQIRGLNIFSVDTIENTIKKLKVDEVLIAMPSISRTKRLIIIEKLEPYPVFVRTLPGVTELAKGRVSIDDLREVSIVDLLGRNVVKPNKSLLSKNIEGKVVMVTGAGGSIGSELCRQIVKLGVKTLILFEQNELALYAVDKELSANKQLSIKPILGSVLNQNRVRQVCQTFGVKTIYHAAAYKHVPMVEFNSSEGIDNNIFGTFNCAQAAIDASVETFVLISTDKAVRPTNTMGATKRIAEMVLQALAQRQSNTKFSMVRFGNVLDSSGSVIPLFRQQIKQGGPVTVTDVNIVRYFMTIPEAVELVIQAGAMGRGGDVFVLDMGKPVRIDALAKKMIRLSGLEVKNESNPSGDVEIKYTGLRPGEKLFEELLIGGKVSNTEHALIMRAEEEMLPWGELESVLNMLNKAVENCDYELLRILLMEIVPGFQPQCDIVDILYKKTT